MREVRPGDHDVRFVFDEGAALSGAASVGADDAATGYYVQFECFDSFGLLREYEHVQLAQNGIFRVDGLPTVRGDLRIIEYGTKLEVAAVLGVVPGSESPVQAQRLNSIHLRSPSKEFALNVRTESGEPVPSAVFSSPTIAQSVQAIEEGFLHWRANETAIDGELHAPGFRAQVLRPSYS